MYLSGQLRLAWAKVEGGSVSRDEWEEWEWAKADGIGRWVAARTPPSGKPQSIGYDSGWELILSDKAVYRRRALGEALPQTQGPG